MFCSRLSFLLLLAIVLLSSVCSFSLSSLPRTRSDHSRLEVNAAGLLHAPSSCSSSGFRRHPSTKAVKTFSRLAQSRTDKKECLSELQGVIESTEFSDHPQDRTDGSAFLTTRGGATTVMRGLLSWEKMKVWVFIALWYGFNIQFNIQNKQLLNAMPLPWTVSILELGAGSLYIGLLWLLKLRQRPVVEKKDVKTLSTLSWFHAVSHITAVSAIGAGAVSFTHVVKSAEPFFSAFFAGVFFKQYFHPFVYAALIPVVGGVSYASVKELNFSLLAFLCAMASNVVCAARGVVVKGLLSDSKPSKNKISTANLYGILTVSAFAMLLPFALILEGPKWASMMATTTLTTVEFFKLVFGAGLSFYLYNEVAFLALESLHPISHAVVNTVKRVVIIGVTVLFFRNPFPLQSQIGSGVAIFGVFLYSLAKHYFH